MARVVARRSRSVRRGRRSNVVGCDERVLRRSIERVLGIIRDIKEKDWLIGGKRSVYHRFLRLAELLRRYGYKDLARRVEKFGEDLYVLSLQITDMGNVARVIKRERLPLFSEKTRDHIYDELELGKGAWENYNRVKKEIVKIEAGLRRILGRK